MDSILGLFNKRNVFDLTHERKFSCDMGKLIPIMVEEVLPGDTFKVSTDMLVRVAPLVAPVMHRVNVFTHYFFVPNRLIWNEWEKFITGDTSGNDNTTWPNSTMQNVLVGSLADYLGVPVGLADTMQVSSLPFRAYAMIYNEWFRDQNLQTKVTCNVTSGNDAGTDTGTVLSRNWEKDYFTSSLPWPQRGTAVQLPLGTEAKVGAYNTLGGWVQLETKHTPNPPQQYVDLTSADVNMPEGTDVVADLSTGTAATINSLRQAFQVQKWMERNARAGVRYIESIMAHFGVKSSDARLQRPEFLGGGRSNLVISEVLQTSSTDVTTPQGNMAGHAFSALKSHEFTKSFEEHGLIIGIMSIMPRTNYQQGINRMWHRASRFDYYWPEFAHLGEQAVLRKEVYATGVEADDNTIFGYQGRYDEYRRRESSVHGDFKTTLNFWHMGRIFTEAPELNSAFVTCNPTKRINAVTTGHNCWVQLINNVKAIRPLPKTGEPGLIDHN